MIQTEITARIDAFVKDLEALIAREALAAVSAALGPTPARATPAPARAPSPRRSRRKRAAKAAPAAKPAAAKADAKPSAKAAPAPGRIEAAVVEYVKANPGSGVEQMVKALRVPTTELKTRVSGLVATKAIRKTGKTRGTRYFPV